MQRSTHGRFRAYLAAPYEAARHIAGVSARELSMVRNRHIDLKKPNAAIATVVNAFAELDVVKAWGDGTAVAADGTQVETYVDNLLAETSIRYGGVGGIAYHYVSDTYVALFSRFIPRGVGGGAPDRGPAGQQGATGPPCPRGGVCGCPPGSPSTRGSPCHSSSLST